MMSSNRSSRWVKGCGPVLVGAALLAGAGAAPGVETLGSEAERIFRQEALAHAQALSRSYRRLEDHILKGSTAATAWSGDIPPPSSGWLDVWTERGVRARYCGDTLIVYMGPARLKGVGRDHRAVHVAPHAYTTGALRGTLPTLHWLEGGEARGSFGRTGVMLPACLSSASVFPEGRAALAGMVVDPFGRLRERVSRESMVEACPAGFHGAGRTLARDVTTTYNGRREVVGAPVNGPWSVRIDQCRADYAQWQRYTEPCTWYAGEPHNKTMTGRDIWRRLKTVSAGGESYGEPEFISTSCWGGAAPALPAVSSVTTTTIGETKTEACGQYEVGDGRDYERTHTERETFFSWDDNPFIKVSHTNWILTQNQCTTAMCHEGGVGGGMVPCASLEEEEGGVPVRAAAVKVVAMAPMAAVAMVAVAVSE